MDYDDEYATCARTYAAVRIFSVNVSPDEITQALGVAPSAMQRKGPVTNAQGQAAGVRPNAWFLSSEKVVPSRDVRRHLDYVLDKLEGKTEAMAALIGRGVRADIACLWVSATHHAGPTLSPSQCRKLAALGIDCWFDFHAGPDVGPRR